MEHLHIAPRLVKPGDNSYLSLEGGQALQPQCPASKALRFSSPHAP